MVAGKASGMWQVRPNSAAVSLGVFLEAASLAFWSQSTAGRAG